MICDECGEESPYVAIYIWQAPDGTYYEQVVDIHDCDDDVWRIALIRFEGL